jgi:hypothetical protein
LTEPNTNPMDDSIREARRHLAQELRSQAEFLEKIEHDLTEARRRNQDLEQKAEQRWQAVELAGVSLSQASADAALEHVLAAVRNLITCTMPEQVFQVLAQEAGQLGVRSAVFDVRGKAAWGAAANGFGSGLTERVFRALIVPLNQENPFRQICETADHVEASTETLKNNRNVLEKLKPPHNAPILLLPIRSAGTVSAILYADPGGEGGALPVNALKILSEFSGAQIDRLIALSGGIPGEERSTEIERSSEIEAPVEGPSVEPASVKTAEDISEEPKVVETPVSEPRVAPAKAAPEALRPDSTQPENSPAPVAVTGPAEEVLPPPVEAPAMEESEVNAAPAASAVLAGVDISDLSEAEQKVHKDAKRFAKLLVSEIELYNKAKVADGRKNKDLYKRLKSDIDRSRQTFAKRFGKTLGKEFDYFHEELVSTLGANDSSALGPEYPGPSA